MGSIHTHNIAMLSSRIVSNTAKQCVRHACTNSLNSVHHVTGSKMSLVDPDKVTLLNMRFCPYAQRTILCLNAKGVEYEMINCALMTSDYVDEVYPGRPLHSPDPATKAKDKMLVELFNKVQLPQMKIWFGWKRGQGPEDRAKHWADCMKNLEIFESELGRRQTAFFGGSDSPGWLDYMIWPWMERINIYPMVFKDELKLAYPSSKFPLLNAWMDKMKEDPAVLEYILDDETHATFVRTIVSGAPNYDLLLNEN